MRDYRDAYGFTKDHLARITPFSKGNLTMHQTVKRASLPEPEPINHRPRPAVGFFAGLSADQKAKALAYKGPEDHGDRDTRLRPERTPECGCSDEG